MTTTRPSPGPLVPALAAAVAALGYTAALGPEFVYPANVEWLMRGDFSLHFFGWHLFRTGPWTWPIGATPHLIWPIGSSVGLTDSIPIAAIAFKLVSRWLPADFQFIGLWLVVCAALQAGFGALLMRLATSRPLPQFLGALLLVLSPPFAFRYGHAALAAHWVLLAALWLALRDGARTPTTRGALAWAGLGAVTAAINPYLLLMVAAIAAAAFLDQVTQAPGRAWVVAWHGALTAATSWASLWQSGSLSVPGEAGRTMAGFGLFSANLLTFVMPTEAGTLFAPGPIGYANPEQYEGYAYLGAGVLALALAVPLLRSSSRRPSAAGPRRIHVPLLLALLFLAVMAWGPSISAGTRQLLAYDGAVWGPLLAFRTNGRMIWPAYYAIVAGLVGGAASLPRWQAAAVLTAALALQSVDMAGMVPWMRAPGAYGFRDPLVSRFWTVVPRHYDRLVLVPSNLCDRDGAPDIRPFALLAGRAGLALNGGATARYDVRKAAAYCEVLDREVRAGFREPGALYVIRQDLLPALTPPPGSGVTCGEVDGFGVCVSAASAATWPDGFGFPAAK